MIPKKIHYCWFGGKDKPKSAEKCIASWKKCCSDYEIVEWNESNFNVNMNSYTKYCYDNKKFAFLSDYVRLLVVEQHGGIYFDTDVEVIKNFDDLLNYPAFFGFESNEYVNTGVSFGAAAHNQIVQQMISEYDKLLDGKNGVVGCPRLNTDALLKFGLELNGKTQKLENAVVFSSDYFNPYDDNTGTLDITDNTYSIHWYSKSWISPKSRIISKLTKPFHRIFGNNCFDWIKKLIKK